MATRDQQTNSCDNEESTQQICDNEQPTNKKCGNEEPTKKMWQRGTNTQFNTAPRNQQTKQCGNQGLTHCLLWQRGATKQNNAPHCDWPDPCSGADWKMYVLMHGNVVTSQCLFCKRRPSSKHGSPPRSTCKVH